MSNQIRSGGYALTAALEAAGIRKIFCVPGESYLDALDALLDSSIRVITCRQEGGAAFMAEAAAKLSGRTGVCFVTRGPGACNASIGVHTAMQDSTPMLLLVGQVARGDRGREAFQEVDYKKMFAPPFTKGVFEAERAEDLPALVMQAVALAEEGRKGPVVISLPEDVLTDKAAVHVPPRPANVTFAPRAHDMQALAEMLEQAERPLLWLGGNGWTNADSHALETFAQKHGLPVVTSFRRSDVFDNTHACYAGALGTTVDAELLSAVRESDLIIAINTRIGDIATQGYSLLTPPRTAQKLVHVYPDAAELNKVYQADLAINSDLAAFCAALDKVHLAKNWQERAQKLHARYLAWSTPRDSDKFTCDLDGVMRGLISELSEDAIITTDAGNFSGWAQRYLRYKRPQRLLAPTSGAMGYGVPAAIAASLARPEALVVGFMGDGGFMMTGQEIATAMQAGAKPILLVFNNNMYGTIRMHQEKHYPGRVSATDLVNPDFAALAKTYGAAGFRVENTADFLPAFKAARAENRLSLIEIMVDPEQLTTGKTLSAIRAESMPS